VYNPGYTKLTIPKLREFIYKYGHHPNFDSAEEIAEKGGMSVIDFQLNQQVTLEEYSLYFIEMDERMTKLEKQSEEKDKKIGKLEKQSEKKDKRIKKLEKDLKIFEKRLHKK